MRYLFLFLSFVMLNGSKCREAGNPSATASPETIVYITDSGKKYHQENCRSLKKSKISISLADAVAKGYEPCKICHSPVEGEK